MNFSAGLLGGHEGRCICLRLQRTLERPRGQAAVAAFELQRPVISTRQC